MTIKEEEGKAFRLPGKEGFCEFSFGIDLSARERLENVTRRIEATTR